MAETTLRSSCCSTVRGTESPSGAGIPMMRVGLGPSPIWPLGPPHPSLGDPPLAIVSMEGADLANGYGGCSHHGGSRTPSAADTGPSRTKGTITSSAVTLCVPGHRGTRPLAGPR